MNCKHALMLIFILLLACFSNSAFPMPEDRDKLIELTADEVSISQQNYHSEYLGNMELDQGSTHLRAAKAETRGNQQNKLIVAIAYGHNSSQAHYWTQTDLTKPLLHAYADIIRYYPDKHLIELIGHAKVIQGKNVFKSTKISFDTVKQHIFSEKAAQGRTTIVFHTDKSINSKL